MLSKVASPLPVMADSGRTAALGLDGIQPIPAWFPAFWSHPLRRPRRVFLWGRPVVLFRDGHGRPVALEDRCPHRGAPLSSGRCQAGTIRCPYHGWRFDGEGKNVEIPALRRAEAHRTVPAYPTHDDGQWIWVYSRPGPRPDVPPPRPFNGAGGTSWTLESRFDASLPLVLENILDVPHTAFVHGGVFRNPAQRSVAVRLEPFEQGAQARFLNEPRPNGWLARLLAPRATQVEHVDRYLHPCVAEVEYGLQPYRVVITSALRPDDLHQTHLFVRVWVQGPSAWTRALRLLEPVGRLILGQDRRVMSKLQENLHLHDRPDNTLGRSKVRLASSEADLLGPVILRSWRRHAEGRQPVSVVPREVRLWV